jgi:BON domain
MTRTKLLLLAAGIALGAFPPAFAAEPAPPATAEDPQLNRAAYSALQGDEELADLNIGARVLRDGTAVLWGTATPAEVAKAEALLKTLKGVTKVVNTCDAAGVPDPLVARVEARVRTAPTAEPVKPTPPQTEAVKADPPAPAAPPQAAGAPVSRHTTTVEKPQLVRAQGQEPAARLLDPAAVRAPVDYAAVDRVRRSDPKFARLTFDLRDGRVVIGGPAGDPAAAWELARKVAPLVGDRDVVVSVGRR